MSEYMDVPVADVQVGDEVKVDGYGVLMTKPGFNYYAPEDDEEYRVVRLRNPRVDSVEVERIVDGIKFGEHTFAFRRSSIVSARRRTPEPSPQPGDWRCRVPGTCPECLAACGCISREVYRASGGWSKDTRTGEPWVMRVGDPVEIVVKSRIGNVLMDLAAAARTDIACGDEFLPDYYRRIGLKVVPVERRKR